MGQRCTIGIQAPDGAVRFVVCQWGAPPKENGRVLLHHYDTPERVNALVALGDLHLLAGRLDPNEGERHSYDQPQHGVTIAYHRDRGDALEAPSVAAGRDGLLGQEWAYVFMEATATWEVRRGDEGDVWQPLAEVLGSGAVEEVVPFERSGEPGGELSPERVVVASWRVTAPEANENGDVRVTLQGSLLNALEESVGLGLEAVILDADGSEVLVVEAADRRLRNEGEAVEVKGQRWLFGRGVPPDATVALWSYRETELIAILPRVQPAFTERNGHLRWDVTVAVDNPAPAYDYAEVEVRFLDEDGELTHDMAIVRLESIPRGPSRQALSGSPQARELGRAAQLLFHLRRRFRAPVVVDGLPAITFPVGNDAPVQPPEALRPAPPLPEPVPLRDRLPPHLQPPPPEPPDPLQSDVVDELIAACAAAATSGRAGAVPRLRQLLTHALPSVRVAALGALGELGGGSVVPVVRRLVDDADEGVRAAAQAAVDRILSRR